MLIMLVKLAVLMSSGLLAGAALLVWIGDRPHGMSDRFYLAFQHARIRALSLPLPLLGAGTLLLTALATIATRSDPLTPFLTGAAFLCSVAGMAITRGINMPINKRMLAWQAETMPAGWQRLRDRWWTWHIARTLLALLAFLCVAIAAVAQPGIG
jgi:hypothetical protein